MSVKKSIQFIAIGVEKHRSNFLMLQAEAEEITEIPATKINFLPNTERSI